jgi:hypothetical protein
MIPDSPQSRLTQQQRAVEQSAARTETAAEFAQVEDLLRADRAQTPPPPALEARVRASLAQEPPPPPRPWWKRWWSRS